MAEKNTDSLAHTTWECKYHVVFAPKFRRQIIYGRLKTEIGKILRTLCERKGIEMLEGNLCPDHVHMLLKILLESGEKRHKASVENRQIASDQKRQSQSEVTTTSIKWRIKTTAQSS